MNIVYNLTKSYDDFKPLINELEAELGSRFPISIENWCGIGERPYPLKTWEVFLVKNDLNTPIGMFSYYQQEEDPVDKFWIGWIGVTKNERRKGFASKFIDILEEKVLLLGAKELWVYTDSDNLGAISFYRARQMIDWGTFEAVKSPQASAKDNSVVLMKYL
ncbi:GNAT family N-acetyltransferase [Thiothrix lacustris]|uniref:GNAT family N-acetyltransferase n=1 Tax=Thiothrix lacustris TaxID=525917 RepID=A0ABY9MPB3_9GAMM|nr:GNAT family N-acetyltransferase [Thiothrix lacustris]WML90217.1 GNAT family N-acetyltransferase [Thiothrix lacustris]